MSQHATILRHELSARNAAYAAQHQFSHVTGCGQPPVIVYQPSDNRPMHGNFISASYQAILRRTAWRRRLAKAHCQCYELPRAEYAWRELDSCMSSDALLMNVFCYPKVTKCKELSFLLGSDIGDTPDFGFRPRVPLKTKAIERTEVDMKLGNMLFEAKLTEGDFQLQEAELVEQYCGLKEVFECRKLPRQGKKYISYQLLRNVLAAYALDMNFCVLLDARRPDLLEDWYRIMRCVRPATLRIRCKVLTWQEPASCLPVGLQQYLDVKYGIVAAA